MSKGSELFTWIVGLYMLAIGVCMLLVCVEHNPEQLDLLVGIALVSIGLKLFGKALK